METIYKRTLFTITALLILFTAGVAQKGVEDGSKYGHGDDSIRALMNLSLYKQYYRQKNYQDAIKPWRIVFFEAPRASKNMYIHGNVMYKTFFQKTKNPELREKYVDTILMIYDQRIKWFNKEGYLTGRKGIDLHTLSPKRKKEAYELLSKSKNMLGNKTPEFIINELMQASLGLYKDEEISKENMVNDFAQSSEILDYQLKHAKNDKDRKQVQTVKDNVELIFTRSGAADCESLVPVLEPKFNESPEDIEVLKNIVALLRTTDCEGTELYAKSAENLYMLEPSANAAYSLAQVFLKKKNFDKTIQYYQEAVKLEKDSLTLGRYYSELANIMLADNRNPSKIVYNAQQAVKYNANDGTPYITMGHAYASAKNFGENEFQEKSVFWVAVDMFYKAKKVDPTLAEKATELIATYSKYFPTNEQIFFHDFNEGQSYTVGGWINRTTTIRAKK